MSLPVKWQEQSYCSCLCIRASQMITLPDFAKAVSLPCTSTNTLRFLTWDKQKFNRLPFLHHMPWNLSSPLVLKSSGLRSIVFAAPKQLYKFSLVTMLTTDGFGRPSEPIFVTP